MEENTASEGTVAKALNVLDKVAAYGRPVRFSTILEQKIYPKATLYRLLQTLTNQGMLIYDHDMQTYAPGMRLVRLAHSAWTQSSLAPIARPFLDKLAASTGETLHLAQMEAGQVIYVDKRKADDPVEMFSQAGKVGPGYCTGVGKAILAFMKEIELERALAQQAFYQFTETSHTSIESLKAELEYIRNEGFAYDREEHEQGIICTAVPIFSNTRVIGAVSITSTTTKCSLDGLKQFQPDLKETAKSIGEAAQTWQFPIQT